MRTRAGETPPGQPAGTPAFRGSIASVLLGRYGSAEANASALVSGPVAIDAIADAIDTIADAIASSLDSRE